MGPRAWLILAAMALARIAFGYQYQTVPTLAPELIAAYGLDYTTIGTLIGVFVAPGIVLALPLGLLGRRFGDRLIVGGGLALMTAGPVISAFWHDPLGIGVGRVIAGCGAVAMIVLQTKIIADWFHGRWFMIGISVSVAAYPIGVSAAQAVLPFIVARGGVFAGMLSASALIGATSILFLACYREASHAAPATHAAPAPRSFSLPSGGECVLVMVAGVIWAAYTGSFGGFISYLPTLMSTRGEPDWLTALLITIVTWGSVAGTLVGGPLALRVGRLPLLVFGTIGATIGCLGIGLLDWPILSAFLFGVLGALPASMVMAAGTLSAQPENRAVGMGLFYTTYYLGNAAAPWLCGRTADLTGGPSGAFFAAAAIGLLAIPFWLLHARLLAGAALVASAARRFAEPAASKLE